MQGRNSDPLNLLLALRTAREQYERDVAKRNRSSKFWKGLVNRWNGALDVAPDFPMSVVDGDSMPHPPNWPRRSPWSIRSLQIPHLLSFRRYAKAVQELVSGPGGHF